MLGKKELRASIAADLCASLFYEASTAALFREEASQYLDFLRVN